MKKYNTEELLITLVNISKVLSGILRTQTILLIIIAIIIYLK